MIAFYEMLPLTYIQTNSRQLNTFYWLTSFTQPTSKIHEMLNKNCAEYLGLFVETLQCRVFNQEFPKVLSKVIFLRTSGLTEIIMNSPVSAEVNWVQLFWYFDYHAPRFIVMRFISQEYEFFSSNKVNFPPSRNKIRNIKISIWMNGVRALVLL